MAINVDGPPLRVELGLMPDGEPIQGHVRGTDGTQLTFNGWLELIQILERVRGGLSRNPP